MITKTAKKKARKFAQKMRMRIHLRNKGNILHRKVAKPRKKDRIFAITPIKERKNVWQTFKTMIRTKMTERIAKRKATEKAKRRLVNGSV